MRWVYLIPRRLYETKMSIGRTLYGAAVSEHPDVDKFMWFGPGWPGWDEGLGIAENLSGLPYVPDVVWCYKADQMRGRVPTWVGTRIVCFNEANNVEQTMKEIDAAQATHVVFHHQDEAINWAINLESTGKRNVAHIPHCAPSWMAHDGSPWDDRRIDVCLTGVISPSVYPLRSKMLEALPLMRQAGLVAEQLDHPGYRLRNRSDVDKQFKEYADVLGESRIALCCTSRYHYALAKLTEAAMAGCMVATDMPNDETYARSLGKHILEIPSCSEPEWIAETIITALTELGEVAKRQAFEGRDLAVASRTTRHYAEHIVDFAQR